MASTKKRILNPLQAETEPHRDGVARIVTRACLSRWAWLCNCGDCSTVSYYRSREPSDEAAVPPVPVRYHEPGRCTLGLAPRGLTRSIDCQPQATAPYRVPDDTSNQGYFLACPRSGAG